ncbi:hypothetical protein [Xylophilus sp. GOD-11R]|uniref:hypothetical protein n=1 Tax=Xylophilus sp. GOD-11R TaxID=3089814 RepID=UPI00298BE5BB|nr:hypothetical protein [Xylophilus sp. GOD-11R]WPB57946.1 hypothetical protein R9X41_04680 [Xylophilus sp. GOD-11R]
MSVQNGADGFVVKMLGERGAELHGADVYYDTQDADFAQPALQAVLEELGMEWLDDRLERSRVEQTAHARFVRFVDGGGASLARCRTASALIASAIGAGLTGALNFGAFALMVAEVNAAMNHAHTGFGTVPAGEFTASAAGRQVLFNLLGAVPGAATYGVMTGISATLVRPLVDAIAVLLSGGQDMSIVAVDPALIHPLPSPMKPDGTLKEGVDYAAEMEINTLRRAEVAARQAEMLRIASFFNLKYGTPLFATCHTARQIYLSILQRSHGLNLAPLSGAALSAAASGVASAGHVAAGNLDRMGERVEIRHQSPGGEPRMVNLPLFANREDLRAIREERRPPLGEALGNTFHTAATQYLNGVSVARKLTFGVTGTALAVYLATTTIDTLMPLGQLLANTTHSNEAAFLVLAGAATVIAYALSYTAVATSLNFVGKKVRGNLERQQKERLARAFGQAMENFVRDHPQEVGRLTRGRTGEWTVGQIGLIYDAMNRAVIADFDAAIAEDRNGNLEPGADRRMRDAYVRRAEDVRAMVVAAGLVEQIPPEDRTPDQSGLLATIRGSMGTLVEQVYEAMGDEDEENRVTHF